MKKLILIRHAKSAWKKENISDFERELSERGYKQAKEMWKILKRLKFKTDYIICSTAVRTWLTLECLSKEYEKLKQIPTIFAQEIYDFHIWWTEKVIEVIKQINDEINSLTIIWHNSLFDELIERLTEVSWLHIPTLWIVKIVFEIDCWEEIEKKWVIKMFISPAK